MSAAEVHRPPRSTRPAGPLAVESLAPPPVVDQAENGSGRGGFAMVPAAGAVLSVGSIVMFRFGGRTFAVLGAALLLAVLLAVVVLLLTRTGKDARRRLAERERYLDHLEDVRVRMRALRRDRRRAALLLDPTPAALGEAVRDPARLWERRRRDADFLRVRVGLGAAVVAALRVPAAPDPLRPFDPAMLAEARDVAGQCPVAGGMPLTLGLDGAEQVALVGDRAAVLGTARALLAQLAAWHAPDDVGLALLVPPDRAADWAGVDLLPHLLDQSEYEGALPARRIAGSTPGLAAVLDADLRRRSREATAPWSRGGGDDAWRGRPRLVVVVDAWGSPAQPLPLPVPGVSLRDLGVTVVYLLRDRLAEPSDLALRVAHEHGRLTVDDLRPVGRHRSATLGSRGDGTPSGEIPVEVRGVSSGEVVGGRGGSSSAESPVGQGVPDDCPPVLLETLARTLAGCRLGRSRGGPVDLDEPLRVTDLLGIGDIDGVGPDHSWPERDDRDFLRVPVGIGDDGLPLALDLKESAHGGMGPHGICVGATGSGKSELLRTLVTSLALTHAPEDLAMVLVDYKGGAAFAPCAGLPQVAGIIDNLADDPQLTERARTSISGELVRRQVLLRDAGMCPSITEYRALRRTRPELPALPHLLLVIDEFGELLTADPDFIDVLTTIGRIGRSVGVHLLLSSQRVEMGKLRGLDTYLSYRIGLRTFSESESSSILGTPDAFHLPSAPGFGYLKVDTTTYTRFRAGFVSGPVEQGPARPASRTREPYLVPSLPTRHDPDAGAPVSPGRPVAPLGESAATEAPRSRPVRSLLAVCVERLACPQRQVRPVWLEPLPARVPLAEVVAAVGAPDSWRAGPRTGRRGPSAASGAGLVLPVGTVDDPATQAQRPWRLDLSRAGGHVAVIGAPQSGRTTFLRTLAVSVATTRTPAEVGVYGIDLAGGGLARISGFPHVGGVATRSQPERLARLLDELRAMLAEREQVFRDRGLDSVAQLRSEHAAGRVPELESAEVLLLVDGFDRLRGEFESLEPAVIELLQRGGGFGIHLMLALARWNDLRMSHQPFVGTHVELHLGDPGDSCVDRRLAATVRADQPGRALTDDRLFAQVALSAVEHAGDARPDGELVEQLAGRVAADWTGARARPIRVLPDDLRPEHLPEPAGPAEHVALGLRQDTLAPAMFEFGTRDQHLLVLGDQGCGKTTLLRGVVQSLVDRHDPEQLVFAVMDLRGEAAAAVPPDYLGAHARTATEARGLGEAVARDLAARQGDPGGGPTPARVVVLVDDYDVLASAGTEPLRPLLPHLPLARDLRVHVVLTRPVAGATRAMFDAALQAVRDTGGSTLVMSGERTEGQVLPRVYAERMPPGRGLLVRRGEAPHVIQVAHFRPLRRAS
ncbi:MAG: type VII secretion protein EccCa [Dermatophilaceae bacterium]